MLFGSLRTVRYAHCTDERAHACEWSNVREKEDKRETKRERKIEGGKSKERAASAELFAARREPEIDLRRVILLVLIRYRGSECFFAFQLNIQYKSPVQLY